MELHKLFMTYLPSRYLISLFFVMGSIIALVIYELIILKTAHKSIYHLVKVLAFVILLGLIVKNAVEYVSSINRRTYEITKIDKYLSKYPFGNNPIIGTWATALSWESKAISFPIWHGYFNDKNILNNYKPKVIISEMDEADSDKAYLLDNINLDLIADSVKIFRINHWNLKLLWINPSVYTKPYPASKRDTVIDNLTLSTAE
jgi:hypothetical protein